MGIGPAPAGGGGHRFDPARRRLPPVADPDAHAVARGRLDAGGDTFLVEPLERPFEIAVTLGHDEKNAHDATGFREDYHRLSAGSPGHDTTR